MITIFAWLVFIPALIWNVLLFAIAFGDLMSLKGKIAWTKLRNIRDLVISLALLFIPGVYLFGWF
jgi:hypothetical protein